MSTPIEKCLNPNQVVKFYMSESQIELLASRAQGPAEAIEMLALGNNVITIEISKEESYMFSDKKTFQQLFNFLDKYEIVYTVSDAFDLLWDATVLNDVLSYIDPSKEDDKESVLSILKEMASTRRSVDDVLDLISDKGMQSLNEIHKSLLTQ